MTSEPKAPEPPAGSHTPQPGRRARLKAVMSRIDWRAAAAVAAVLLLAGIWLDSRARSDELQRELARKLEQAQAYNQESRQLAAGARDAMRELEYKIGMLESRLSETQNQRLALEALYLELSRSRDERILAEVEQTLLAGSQQLKLAGNLKAALIALESADSRLQRADSAQFTALRRAIRRDVERLKAAPYVDVVGMSLRLDSLAHQVDAFPLAMYERPVEPVREPARQDEGTATRLAREVWEDIKGLIRVQRIDSTEVPVVSPSQEFFLRENLRMRLLSARIALLAQDQAGFKADTRSAVQWLQRYFDTKDEKVGTASRALRQLAESEIGADLPDLSASLEAVRDARIVRERGLR